MPPEPERSAYLAALAALFQVPVHLLTGGVVGGDPEAVRRYIVTINALHKGTKRRARRARAKIKRKIRRL